MKTIKVISDTTFELIANAIKSEIFKITALTYTDDLVVEIVKLSEKNFPEDILYVHADAYFKSYSEEYVSNLITAVLKLSCSTIKTIIVTNRIAGWFSDAPLSKTFGKERYFLAKFQLGITQLLDVPNFYFFDLNNCINTQGVSACYNFKTGHLYQMPYTKVAISQIAKQLSKWLDKIISPDKKVIILDCDNTLWNGIVGEDGVPMIKCNNSHEGITYYRFQQFLKSKKQDGFLLCLCSKNNMDDVKLAFETLNMPLEWSDFIIKKVNWLSKPKNIETIANELNLGADSFIFIDDNLVELEFVNITMPEVCTFHFQNDYRNFLQIIDDPVFAKKTISQEDKAKTEQYQSELQRKSLLDHSVSFEEYIKRLNIELTIKENDERSFERIAQLTEKTNQFNFNKVCFNKGQLVEFVQNNNIIVSLNVKDRFSDYGLVGVIFVCLENETAIVLNYILSCRALGRNIEYEFWNKAMEIINSRKLKIKSIWFNETEKNMPAKQFVEELNFRSEFRVLSDNKIKYN